MNLLELSIKKKYNQVLKRFWKATIHFENTETTEEQQAKWLPEYLKVVEECRSYISQLYSMGCKATEEEIKQGFSLEEPNIEQLQMGG